MADLSHKNLVSIKEFKAEEIGQILDMAQCDFNRIRQVSSGAAKSRYAEEAL
jgi:aspartate carbamoyltransferase catalytic subunit